MHMDYNRIDILLKKYWEGETSLEEEKELREFFATHEGDARWAHEAALFRYFGQSASEERLGEFFDHRILDEISRESRRSGQGNVRQLWFNIGKVAAVITVLVAAVYFSVQDYRDNQVAIQKELGTYEDPKKAYEETKKALLLISQSMGKGTAQAQKVSVFHEAQETVRKGTEPVSTTNEDKK